MRALTAATRIVRRARVTVGRDDGMNTLELLFLAVPLLLLLAGLLQGGLFWLAENNAHTAARKGAAAGSAYQASPADGAARAREWISQVGVVNDPAVSTSGSTADRVRVTVSGRAPSMLPWLMTLTVSKSAERPVERFDVTP
ncbi:TadE/TadG family type IV pilus assembly protein [Streptomyces arboris]|uniref:TadE/TadG family type IV pilus assembly protein n=1 Tax=Streptomyces arboris TaxID=2600619 RepID=UPI003639E398